MEVRESDSDTRRNGQSRIPAWQAVLFLVALLLMLAGLFASVTQWGPLRAEAVVATPKQPARPDVPTASFEYFPDQYVNQGTRVEEHIQAF